MIYFILFLDGSGWDDFGVCDVVEVELLVFVLVYVDGVDVGFVVIYGDGSDVDCVLGFDGVVVDVGDL